jgi:hypothetical protein
MINKCGETPKTKESKMQSQDENNKTPGETGLL